VEPTDDRIRRAPKVVLHDHLDGGLRPATVIELAAEAGYDGLPTRDADELAAWFDQSRSGGDLVRYLEAFRHTVAVMQSTDALERVAAECAEDLASDGLVYAEVRFGPELHEQRGLTLEAVVEAVLTGFRHGSADRGIEVRTILCAIRDADRSLEVATLAGRYLDEGVVGFDIAGPEAGHPPTEHLAAFERMRELGGHVTIHAGEADGPASIRAALDPCGAERLGHGVRVTDDISTDPDGRPRLGPVAMTVLERQVPLELCPTSNVHTGVAASVADHPIDRLRHLGLRVTVNTDNRLMSRITLTDELAALVAAFGCDLADLEDLTVAAMESAFCPPEDRRRIIDAVIRPGYAALREEVGV
jgi:adenosine deaminase